ncbi:MAG: SpoIIE family protein phosphatase [Bacteroidales bacterium]|nr:SpoIIE family protein phosphatase [Bacteroidales bacterium]
MKFKTKIFSLVSTIWLLMSASAVPSLANEVAYLDSLQALLFGASGTTESIGYAEKLYQEAKKVGNFDKMRIARGEKLSMLQSLARYDECIALADSIIAEESDPQTGILRTAYYAYFIKVVTYIDKGHYKTAIQLAQKLYDVSKNPIYTRCSLGDTDSTDISISVRVNALMGLGLANGEMERDDLAMRNFTEGIELVPETDTSVLYVQKLELQTYRMQSAQKLSDKVKALQYVSTYEKEFNDFRKHVKGTSLEDIFIEDYALLMQIAYVDVYTELRQAEQARAHLMSADSIVTIYDMADQYLAELMLAKAKYYNLIGNFSEAMEQSQEAAEYYRNAENPNRELSALKSKLTALHSLKLYINEYDVAQRIFALSDSIYMQRYNSQIADMQTVMNYDKLEQQAETMRAQAEAMRAQKQMWIFISLSVLFAAVAIFAFFKRRKDAEKQRILSGQKEMLEKEVERQTRQLREQNEEIESQNEALAVTNEKIKKQNIEITDSINYAQRIQRSVLPNLDFFKGFGNGGCFELYVPCHIVSGDFYWARRKGGIDIVVCADCTGHGVPGAFMTMIGTTILNDLCDHNDLIDPANMLEDLHENLLAILQQNGEEDSKDGMDLTIMVFDPVAATASIASAKRPVFFYSDGKGTEVEGVTVKRSIGERDYNRNNLPFKTVVLNVKEGDAIYMSSDGLSDLYGGPKHKRFMKKRQVEMQDAICTLPIAEQKEKVYQTYRDWLTNGGTLSESEQEQLDDVSFIGVIF